MGKQDNLEVGGFRPPHYMTVLEPIEPSREGILEQGNLLMPMLNLEQKKWVKKIQEKFRQEIKKEIGDKVPGE